MLWSFYYLLFILLMKLFFFFFFFNDTATTEIYTLSLHDALPISNCIVVFCCQHSGTIVRGQTTDRPVVTHQLWRAVGVFDNRSPFDGRGAVEIDVGTDVVCSVAFKCVVRLTADNDLVIQKPARLPGELAGPDTCHLF